MELTRYFPATPGVVSDEGDGFDSHCSGAEDIPEQWVVPCLLKEPPSQGRGPPTLPLFPFRKGSSAGWFVDWAMRPALLWLVPCGDLSIGVGG